MKTSRSKIVIVKASRKGRMRGKSNTKTRRRLVRRRSQSKPSIGRNRNNRFNKMIDLNIKSNEMVNNNNNQMADIDNTISDDMQMYDVPKGTNTSNVIRSRSHKRKNRKKRQRSQGRRRSKSIKLSGGTGRKRLRIQRRKP